MDSTAFFEKVMPYVASLSVLLPAVSLFIEWKNISPKYKPLFYWILLKLVSEVGSSVIRFFYKDLGISRDDLRSLLYGWYNTFVLIEAFLLFWMFYAFKNKSLWSKRIYGVLLALCLVIFCAEWVYLGNYGKLLSFYRVVVSFIFVFISVDHINYLLVNERRVVWKNAEFLVCCGLVLYFCYKLLVEVFYYYARENKEFDNHIYVIQQFIIVLFNIILLFAILCLPRKQNFSRYLS
jgi:hypothetical protein